ncbi:hypothetical protein BDV98DRAFT_590733 [Pterulicium gracile]|uniref:Uncharacterized protein n=1 Tax=Pterulicium gracile TaxID=1884261 RepID=A0A5C3QU56_9AGAR|nr:hypothetical protein BDV98DRAFT_590733 [Pterula gracilis]
MVSRKDHVKDLCTAPEEVLSMESSADDRLQFRHTIGDVFVEETYDIPVTRSALNLNLSAKLPELLDELTRACAENLDPHIADSVCDWTPLNPNTVIPRIICRASNRVFIGGPLFAMKTTSSS